MHLLTYTRLSGMCQCWSFTHVVFSSWAINVSWGTFGPILTSATDINLVQGNRWCVYTSCHFSWTFDSTPSLIYVLIFLAFGIWTRSPSCCLSSVSSEVNHFFIFHYLISPGHLGLHPALLHELGSWPDPLISWDGQDWFTMCLTVSISVGMEGGQVNKRKRS